MRSRFSMTALVAVTLMMVLSITSARAGGYDPAVSIQVLRQSSQNNTWSVVSGKEIHVTIGDSIRLSYIWNLSCPAFAPIEMQCHVRPIFQKIDGADTYHAIAVGSASFYGMVSGVGEDAAACVRVYVDPCNIRMDTDVSHDPDGLMTVTTTVTNMTSSVISWISLSGQVGQGKITMWIDGSSATSAVAIPTGYQIRTGSYWMIGSEPSFQNWLWIGGTLATKIYMGNIPPFAWRKIRFRLQPITLATVNIYPIDSKGASISNYIVADYKGYLALVDGQHYKVVAHLPGHTDDSLTFSLGNCYNPEFPTRTTAWLSGGTFWCSGPGCNELFVTVLDKKTLAALAWVYVPVIVPAPSDLIGKGLLVK